ncbi:hypothetical protein H8891_07355 [Paeniclostridium sp. NSJ-45]|uniref:Cohesin domain-containing protein n=1 Tax=Paeniclostridium hominis TaxID=2764329 RepID=A0ABR7K3G1_9FIRM|nr:MULTISPECIES: cohesin domain-containing protein [Paeniclostridium]MBC6003615.1 hypothetical protein [Paeniclostridium hominis]
MNKKLFFSAIAVFLALTVIFIKPSFAVEENNTAIDFRGGLLDGKTLRLGACPGYLMYDAKKATDNDLSTYENLPKYDPYGSDIDHLVYILNQPVHIKAFRLKTENPESTLDLFLHKKIDKDVKKITISAKDGSLQKLDEEFKDYDVECIALRNSGKVDDKIYEFNVYTDDKETTKSVLDIEPVKEKIKLNEEAIANLTINNITEIAAEDISLKYDNEKLKFISFEEVEGVKLVKDIQDDKNGKLRVILASKGEANIINSKKTLLKLKFKGIKKGEAIVDVTKGRVSDGIEMEKDLTDKQCDEGKIIIEEIKDVNKSGEFTLLDLAIDARHLNKNPKAQELSKYNTDISINDAIDENDLLEIGKLMIDNPSYEPNKY